MEKVHPEIVPDVNSVTESVTPDKPIPRELPPPLADFRAYVDSKCCYHSAPFETAELVGVELKVAYKCELKILVEDRRLIWTVEPSKWDHERIFLSATIGRWLEDTKRGGQPVGDLWEDYYFSLPSTDKKCNEEKVLIESCYLTRCDDCRGKGTEKCTYSDCNGLGQIQCPTCDGRVRIETTTQIIVCGCGNGKVTCPKCRGDGKVNCSSCAGLGGFYHKATLRAEWHTLITTWYDQNSTLPEKKIKKAQLHHFWSNTNEPWSPESSVDQFFDSLEQDEAEERIPLKNNLLAGYMNLHTMPTSDGNNRMRRFACAIAQMKFEEITYTLDKQYTNQQNPALENTFRFWKYPTKDNKQQIYENDYPLNCCGCCGIKSACYSSYCSIL